jgi:hypothetical protein
MMFFYWHCPLFPDAEEFHPVLPAPGFGFSLLNTVDRIVGLRFTVWTHHFGIAWR